LIVCSAVTLLTLVLTQEEILNLHWFQRLELASLDYRFLERGTRMPDSSKIVIVEVSDESFKSLPERWPWPRSYYAHIVRNLKAAGAKTIGIDILLSESDQRSTANDNELKSAIRETGIVVLAGKMDMQDDNYVAVRGEEDFGNLFFPIDSSLGLVNIRNDADGVYRRYSPFWENNAAKKAEHSPQRIPTFSFAVLNNYLSLPPLATATNNNDSFEFVGHTIPKFDPSSMLINFYGPSGTFRRVKFADVIDDETMTTTEEARTGQQINTFSDPDFGYKNDGTFKDKIVLVGSTMPEDHDLFPVSIAGSSKTDDNLMYGVEIHANVIESILRNEFLRRQSRLSEIILIILLSFGTFFLTSALRSGKSTRHFVLELLAFIFVLFTIGMIGVAGMICFIKFNLVIVVIAPMVTVGGGYIASTGYHYAVERKQRVMIKDMFSTYVNPTVVDELIANPDKLRLGGERRELTALFSDIEGFTTISEKMQTEQLVALLNEYFTMMTGIILKHRGTLDKFLGDAVIAFWGSPLPQEDHALRACTSALEMQDILENMRTHWQTQGIAPLRVRIGINTGDMIVGNMGGFIGGKRTFNYTIIGDNVNVASRLEGANKEYNTGIIVSQVTYDLVKEKILGRELDLITVKGRTDPLRIYELIQLKEKNVESALKQFLDLYAEGLRLFRLKNWKEAEAAFRSALLQRGGDYPTGLYLERIKYFTAHPPPENWDGVFDLPTK
ncbi:MAG: adenylate/guanylate cyclase domain-containing protein, partial [bacterium]